VLIGDAAMELLKKEKKRLNQRGKRQFLRPRKKFID